MSEKGWKNRRKEGEKKFSDETKEWRREKTIKGKQKTEKNRKKNVKKRKWRKNKRIEKQRRD